MADIAVCPRCGSISHNPGDTGIHPYCGRCHQYHDILIATALTPNCSEADFEDTIIEWAAVQRWRRHAQRGGHTTKGKYLTAIKGDRGWPDIQLAHPTRGIIIAELKTDKGTLGPGQREWLTALAAHDTPGSPILIELWRPADWPAIVYCLTNGIDDYRARYRPG